MENNRQKYRELCEKEKGISIFSQAWWLDAVCGEDNWDVVIVEKGGAIVASMPIYFKKAFIFKGVKNPHFTPRLGPWIKYFENQKYTSKLNYEKEIMYELINKLPKFDYFNQRFNYNFTNWLPFYWKGFMQTTMYSYIIEDVDDVESVVKKMDYSKIKNINKAKKIVTIKHDLSAKEFYANHKTTLAKQGEKIIYNLDLFERIYDASYRCNSGKVIYGVDSDNNIHSALFTVWDEMSAYALISTIDPDFRNSGSATLVFKEMMQYVSTKTKVFDFEGSMIENIENSFRKYGAKQVPYFKIMKYNSLPLKLIKALF